MGADSLCARKDVDGGMKVDWHAFDYADKANTAPPAGELVWIREDFYEDGVTLGQFDGWTFTTYWGSDDCSVSWWAPIVRPDDPGPGAE